MGDSRILAKGKFLELHQRAHWEYCRRPHSDFAVGMLAITPEQEILLVRQYRIPMQQYVIELPAGIVADEHADEAPLLAAKRELEEECGYVAADWQLLLASPTSAGMTCETTLLYLARGLCRSGEGGGVCGENIEVIHLPLAGCAAALAEMAKHQQVDFKIQAALFALAGLEPQLTSVIYQSHA